MITTSLVISSIGQCSALGVNFLQFISSVEKNAPPMAQKKQVLSKDKLFDVKIYTTKEFSLSKKIPEPIERRMSHFSKMCFSAIEDCIQSCSTNLLSQPERIGLIVATTFASIENADEYQKRIIQKGRLEVSPNLFISSIQNTIASYISLIYEIQGPCSTLVSVENPVLNAFQVAKAWIFNNQVDKVFIVAGDEVPEQAMHYFKDKVIFGEGAVCFLVEKNSPNDNSHVQIESIKLSGKNVDTDKFDFNFTTNIHKFFPKQLGFANNDLATCTNHAHLYGYMPSSIAFEIAIAAIKLKLNKNSTAQIIQANYLQDYHYLTLRNTKK